MARHGFLGRTAEAGPSVRPSARKDCSSPPRLCDGLNHAVTAASSRSMGPDPRGQPSAKAHLGQVVLNMSRTISIKSGHPSRFSMRFFGNTCSVEATIVDQDLPCKPLTSGDDTSSGTDHNLSLTSSRQIIRKNAERFWTLLKWLAIACAWSGVAQR